LASQGGSLAFSPDERFLYVSGTPVTYIVNRRTLEILGSFVTGEPQVHSVGHMIGSDKFGNIYEAQADLPKSGIGAYKFAFKGYSPRTPCCRSTRIPDSLEP
jgi:hypothetical protein